MIRQKSKNRNLILYSLLFLFQGAFSQTIEQLYVNMPNALNPTLTKQNRLELLEYYKEGQSDSITNRFGNQAHVTVLDSIHQIIKVKNTDISTFEIKMFRLNDKMPIVGVISTVCALACQSNIQFYDTAWNSIPLKFKMPPAIEWLKTDSLIKSNIDNEWVKKMLSISFVTLSFDIETSKIWVTNNILQFVSEKERKEIEPFVSNNIFSYHLKDTNWVKE